MARRRLWVGIVGAMVASVAFVALFPTYRLDSEIAAARRDGLWTQFGDVRNAISLHMPTGENAAPLVRQAIEECRVRRSAVPNIQKEILEVSKGSATTQEVSSRVREFVVRNSDLVAQWRAASQLSRLDYDRKWEDGFAVLLPEYSGTKDGVRLLTVAAHFGIDPKENLLAAARLSKMSRQEPNLIAQLASISMARIALREAKKLRIAGDIERALGPPIDVRWALAGDFPNYLDAMQRLGKPGWREWLGIKTEETFSDRLRHAGPWQINATYRMVQKYRLFLRELPKDGTDYEAAIKVMDRRLPALYTEMASSSEVLGILMDSGSKDVSQPVKAFQNFEAERKAIRNNRHS